MKDFFIVGVEQQTLLKQLENNLQEELKPEVLFSMYQKKEYVRNFL